MLRGYYHCMYSLVEDLDVVTTPCNKYQVYSMP